MKLLEKYFLEKKTDKHDPIDALFNNLDYLHKCEQRWMTLKKSLIKRLKETKD